MPVAPAILERLREASTRWVIVVLVAVVVGYALYASTAELTDPDVFWVAATGREALLHGYIPRTNLFSFTDPSHPWLMHEWLFATPYAVFMAHGGGAAFGLLAAVAFAIATFTIADFFVSQTTRLPAALALIASTIGLYAWRFLTARPTAIALVLCLVFSAIILRPGLTAKRAAALVLLELVWTNAHGSFIVGVGLGAVSAVVFANEWRARSVLTAALLVVTVANPYGFGLHRFAFAYFAGRDDIYAVIAKHIEDFQSIYAFPVTGIKLLWGAVLLQLALSLGALVGRRFRVRGAIALALLVLEVRNVRNIHLGGIVSIFLLAPYVDHLFRRRAETASFRRAKLLPLALGVSALAAGLLGFVVTPAPTPDQPRFVTPGGIAGAEWVDGFARIPDGARLYVPFSVGGVAIWLGFPRGITVFFDPRNDCYSAKTAEAAFALREGNLSVDEAVTMLRDPGTTHVLVPKGAKLAGLLRASTAYRVAAELPDLVLFERAPAST